MKNLKQQGKSPALLLASAVVSAAGLMVYLVNTLTGYMAGRGLNVTVVAATTVAIIALVADAVSMDKLNDITIDGIMVGAAVLQIIGFLFFVLDRVSIVADVYFLPVNYPAAEETALNISIVGFVLYILAIILAAVAAFSTRPSEKE